MEANDEDVNALVEAIARSLGVGFIESGDIDPNGMSPDELITAIAERIKELVTKDTKFSVVIDHQGELLAQARSFAASNETNFAVMFYATWIEHWINRMIAWKLRALGRNDKAVRRLIMRLGLDQKVGAAWALLFDEPLPDGIGARIKEVAESRNSFVHYKWEVIESDRDPASGGRRDAEKELLSRAELVVTELEAIRDRLVMGGFGAAAYLSENGGRIRYSEAALPRPLLE